MGVPVLVHAHHLEASYAALVAGPILDDLQVLHFAFVAPWLMSDLLRYMSHGGRFMVTSGLCGGSAICVDT